MTKPQFRVQRLDRRFKACGEFDYYIEPGSFPLSENYLELREWFWESFGPGADIDMFVGYNPPERTNKYRWAWHDNEYRIYVKNSAELTVFELKWM